MIIENKNILASVEEIIDIKPHFNADALEIAVVLGFECIVKKNLFSIGEKVILIRPDSVLPNDPNFEFYKKFNPIRVKAQKIRQVWSYGIIEKINIIHYSEALEIGDEVGGLLGITKYTAPDNSNTLNALGELPFNIPKTDEINIGNIRNPSLVMGQLIDVSLKIDGSSASYYYKDGEFGCLSRSLNLNLEDSNKYTRHIKQYDLYNKLSQYCTNHKVNLCLRGESYGKGIQSSKNNPYSKLDNNISFYSVWLIDEMRYAMKGDKHYFINVCKELELPYVPVLEEDVILTRELINKYSNELTNINGEPFEGVVIKGNDFSFKVINKVYDSKK